MNRTGQGNGFAENHFKTIETQCKLQPSVVPPTRAERGLKQH